MLTLSFEIFKVIWGGWYELSRWWRLFKCSLSSRVLAAWVLRFCKFVNRFCLLNFFCFFIWKSWNSWLIHTDCLLIWNYTILLRNLTTSLSFMFSWGLDRPQSLPKCHCKVWTAWNIAHLLVIKLLHQLRCRPGKQISRTQLSIIILAPTVNGALHRQRHSEILSNWSLQYVTLDTFDSVWHKKLSEWSCTPEEETLALLWDRGAKWASHNWTHRYFGNLFYQLACWSVFTSSKS